MSKEEPFLMGYNPVDIFSVASKPDYWSNKGVYFIGGQVGVPVRYEDSTSPFIQHLYIVNYHPGTMYSQPEVKIENFNGRWETLANRERRILWNLGNPPTIKPIAIARFYVPGENEKFFDRMKELREAAIQAGEDSSDTEAYRESFKKEILGHLTPLEIQILDYPQ